MTVQPTQIDAASNHGVIGGLRKECRQNGLLTEPRVVWNSIVVLTDLAEHKPRAMGRIPVSAQPVRRVGWRLLTDLQQVQWPPVTAAHALLQLSKPLDRRAQRLHLRAQRLHASLQTGL